MWDAREAARAVASFIDGADEAEYLNNPLLRSAVERQLEIVGEALGQLEKVAPELAEEIPELRAAVDLRNILIHGYAKVNDRIIWNVACKDLPRLAGELDVRLQEPESRFPRRRARCRKNGSCVSGPDVGCQKQPTLCFRR
ncbi:DUF86 domain-containing protein [Arhodomonas sp. KWT2]|uniref:HepT-like ribonuclease domain-containing protein n=1 Tax=unclassified Arhodomonas TaxID=2621637 RepID=UPI0013D2A574